MTEEIKPNFFIPMPNQLYLHTPVSDIYPYLGKPCVDAKENTQWGFM